MGQTRQIGTRTLTMNPQPASCKVKNLALESRLDFLGTCGNASQGNTGKAMLRPGGARRSAVFFA